PHGGDRPDVLGGLDEDRADVEGRRTDSEGADEAEVVVRAHGVRGVAAQGRGVVAHRADSLERRVTRASRSAHCSAVGKKVVPSVGPPMAVRKNSSIGATRPVMVTGLVFMVISLVLVVLVVSRSSRRGDAGRARSR